MMSFFCLMNAHAQSAAFASPQPVGSAVALTLTIPFGGAESAPPPMLALTLGPAWRQPSQMHYEFGALRNPHAFTAGISLDGAPVLSLGSFDLVRGGVPLLHANESGEENGETGGVLIGVAVVGGLVALAMAGGGSGGGHDLGDAWSEAIGNLGEKIAENCPAFPLESCPPPE
jgi:hypothetical protein